MSTRSGRTVAFSNNIQDVAPVPELKRDESWQHVDDIYSRSGSELSNSLQDLGNHVDFDAMDYQEAPALDEAHEDILHPLREAANRVGKEVERFAEVLDHYNPLKATNDEEKKEMAFDLIEEYHEIALIAVQRLRDEQRARGSGPNGALARIRQDSHDPDAMDEDDSDESVSARGNSRTTPEDLDRWEKEARTWDLLHRMAMLKHCPPEPKPINQIHRYSPESEIWEAFLSNDTLGLERCAVLQWLKDTANESGEDISDLVQDLQQNAERGDITAHGWLHTKEAIKKQKRLHAWPYILDHTSPDVQRIHMNQSNTEPLISQLDPDAPLRQNRKLEAPDEYFERSIWRGCYELLRRGKSGREIQDWCQERQEVWRAVSMSGLPDVVMSSEDGVVDTKSKALWRRMCFALAKREVSDPYESAVYGILSGDYHSVPEVCRTWDDYLFAHFNALVRSQYENYVLANFPQRIPQNVLQLDVFDASSFYGESQTVAARTVEMVNRIEGLEKEIQQPLKHVQGVLIAQTFRHFIIQQGLALSAELSNDDGNASLIKPVERRPERTQISVPYVKSTDFDGLRLLTHMTLAHKSFGMEYGTEEEAYAIENIIVAYISLLRLSGKEELIPLYAAQLSEERAYATLSRVLLDVTAIEQRGILIKLMQELGLDVQKFVKLQFENVMKDYPDVEGQPATAFRIVEDDKRPITELVRQVRPDFMHADLERPEELMVSAFEWFLEVSGMWSDTFNTGLTIYKRFFKQGKLSAARHLAQKMPVALIVENKTPIWLGKAYDLAELLDAEPSDSEEEGDGVVEANMKRYMASQAKPYMDLENLINAISYFEDMAGGLYELQNAQNESDTVTSHSLRQAFMKNLPDLRATVETLFHNWLPRSSISTDPALQSIKATYLPEVIMAYNWIQNAAGIYIGREVLLDNLDFATMVAQNDELTELLVETGRIKAFVQHLASSAMTQMFSVAPGKREVTLGKAAREKGLSQDIWKVTV